MNSLTKALAIVATLVVVALVSSELRHNDRAINQYTAGGEYWYSLDSDGLYHMRRLAEFRKSEADSLPVAFDGNLNYPDGAIVPWPPYYTLIADNLVDEGQEANLFEMQMASLPMKFSVATSVLVALAGMMLAGPIAGFVAGMLHATNYSAIHYGSIGVADHHALVSLLSCLLLVAFSFLIRFGGFSSLRFVVMSALVSGAASGVLLGIWVGSLLYVIPLQLLSVWWLYKYFNRQVPLFVVLFHFAALILLWPAIAQSPWKAEYPWMVINLSYFHALWLGLGVILPLPIWWMKTQLAVQKYLRTVLAMGGAICAMIFAFDIPPADGILEGFAWVSRADEFMAGIAESAPLIGDMGSQQTGFWHWIGIPALLLPFSYWLAAGKNKLQSPMILPWLIALPPMLLQAVAQRRFAEALAAPLAVVAGVSVVWLLVKYKIRAQWAALVVIAFVLLSGYQGSTYAWAAKNDQSFNAVTSAERELFAWIGQQPSQQRSVLAAWDFGHTIEWVSRRPSVATNFGSYIGRESFVDPAKFFMSTDPVSAEQILQRRDVQYVVVSSRLPDLLASQASRAGLDVNEYRKISGAKQLQLLGKWFQTMAARVFNFGDADGPAGPTPSLDCLRLVYVSPVVVKVAEQLGGQTSAGRVWEYVAGADVHGSAPPDTDVTVQVKFHFLAQSKVLVANSWNTTVRSGPDGKFNLRVPYCSGANGEAQVSEMSYTTTLGKTNFTLTESQVLNGDTVVLK